MKILGGRWVLCFQFRKEVSSLFVHYWDWLHSQGSVSRGRAIIVLRGVLEDLLLALCYQPLMLFDLRLRTSPLVVASDASATGIGVCRTSSLEPKGLLALAALQEGLNFHGEEIGLIEVGTTPGGVRQAFARLTVKPGAYAIVGARDESKRIIQQTWPGAMVSDASTELTETEITDLMNRAPRSDKWRVAGAENEPSSIWTTVTLIQKNRCVPALRLRSKAETTQQHGASVRERAVPDETDCVPVDRHIIFPRSAAFLGILENQIKRVWEKLHEALRLIGSTSSTESSLHFTPPSGSSHRKNQPSIVKRSILDSRLTTRCHAYPHLLSRHGQKSWSQYDGQF